MKYQSQKIYEIKNKPDIKIGEIFEYHKPDNCDFKINMNTREILVYLSKLKIFKTRELKILFLKYHYNKTNEEISKIVKVQKERVRCILGKCGRMIVWSKYYDDIKKEFIK